MSKLAPGSTQSFIETLESNRINSLHCDQQRFCRPKATDKIIAQSRKSLYLCPEF
jgi:hypothetical protein